MEKVTGIKSVDFKITALGHGVVNWNGSTKVKIWDARKNQYTEVKNHNMPKLRGYTNIAGQWDDGNPQYKLANQVDFDDTPLYISQNCISPHLFRAQSYKLNSEELKENPEKLLCSITGLIRGYVIPSNENKRTSPLLITDFVDQLGKGNFEQMGRSGSKEKEENKVGKETSNAIFSKTTFGDTKYLAYGSISIEQLQFVPLSADFGRESIKINNHKEGQKVAEELSQYVQNLSGNSEAKAIYHENYVRKGSIFNEGEAGILFNDEAIDVLVTETIELIKHLSIRQAKGYMYVDEVLVDYNDSHVAKDMFRIKTSYELGINPEKRDLPYAIYYEGSEL
jgi:hypothetical protein